MFDLLYTGTIRWDVLTLRINPFCYVSRMSSRMTAARQPRTQKCPITRHFLCDNFEFTIYPNSSFSAVILGSSQSQNDQEES